MGQRRASRSTRHDTRTSRRSPLVPGPGTAEAALIIFAKAPIPGDVKTRLCPPLTPDEAATLHGTFVLDAVERSRDAIKQFQLSLDRFLACSPSPEHAFFKVLEARHGVRLIAQTGDDLGTRMCQALDWVLRQGYRGALLLGTDIPSLPVSVYRDAMHVLGDHDVVFGPALDGGYYLIGLKQVVPELFTNIPWSTDEVLSSTLEKTERLGLHTALLQPCRDVDRLEDLKALIGEVGAGLGASGLRRAQTSASSDFGELRLRRAQSSRRAVEPSSRQRLAGKKAKDFSPLAPGPSPLTHSLSKRTAGVLRALAARLRDRSDVHQ